VRRRSGNKRKKEKKRGNAKCQSFARRGLQKYQGKKNVRAEKSHHKDMETRTGLSLKSIKFTRSLWGKRKPDKGGDAGFPRDDLI